MRYARDFLDFIVPLIVAVDRLHNEMAIWSDEMRPRKIHQVSLSIACNAMRVMVQKSNQGRSFRFYFILLSKPGKQKTAHANLCIWEFVEGKENDYIHIFSAIGDTHSSGASSVPGIKLPYLDKIIEETAIFRNIINDNLGDIFYHPDCL